MVPTPRRPPFAPPLPMQPGLRPASPSGRPRFSLPLRTIRPPLPFTLVLALITGMLALPSSPLAAQGGEVSVLVGATYPTLRGVEGLDGRSGTLTGLRFVRPLGSTVAFQPEFLVTGRGADTGTELLDGGRSLRINAVEVPLLLRISFAPRSRLIPHVYAGPYLSLNVDCSIEGGSGSCDDVPGLSTNTVDAGGIAGGGVGLQAGPLVVNGGVRYAFGVSSLAEFELNGIREEARHGSWALYVGAGIRRGGR